MKIKNKIINALYGLAVCDAVGNPFEFKMNITQENVLEYAQKTEILTISDDTQMTLFGFDAIYNILLQSNVSISDIFEKYFIESYLNWYRTQTESFSDQLSSNSRLLDFQSLWSIQSPG